MLFTPFCSFCYYLFISSLDKYILNIYYVPVIVVGPGTQQWLAEIKVPLHMELTFYLVWQTGNQWNKLEAHSILEKCINYYGENKVGKNIGSVGEGSVGILKGRSGTFSPDVRFEERPRRREGVRWVYLWLTGSQRRGSCEHPGFTEEQRAQCGHSPGRAGRKWGMWAERSCRSST